MAVYTTYANKSALTKSETPSVNYSTGTEFTLTLNTSGFCEAYYGFDNSIAASLLKKQITNVDFLFYVTSRTTGSSIWGDIVTSAWAESGVTFLNKPGRIISGFSSPAVTAGTYNTLNLINGANNFASLINYGMWYMLAEPYTGATMTTLSSRATTNKPYLSITAVDAVPVVKNPYPASGFIDEGKPVTFGWTFAAPAGTYGTLAQTSAKFRWKPTGGEYTEIEIDGTQNTITIPADTFTTDGIQWQVILKSDDNIESSDATWYTLTTVDSSASAEIITPKGVFIDGEQPTTFAWKHIIETGSTQYRYDLQYSTNAVETWVDFGSAVSEIESATIVPDTLPAGNVYWRVRTYNSDGIAGEWSAAAEIIVQAAPPAPTITTINTLPRPSITWQSLGQQGYQVKTDGYDSGTIYGTIKQHKIPVFLSDGVHEVSVRVQNSFSLWSEWSTVSATIANVAGIGVSLLTQSITNGVLLQWEGNHNNYIVYRDGEKVTETTNTEFTDWLTIDSHDYTVRGVTGDYYYMSNISTATPNVKEAAIAVIGDYNWLQLKMRRGSKPVLDFNETEQVVYQHYSGRSKPIAETNGFYDSSYSFSFSFRTKAEVDKFRSMRGKTVVYKDTREMCVGILQLNVSVDRASWDVSGTIVEVDYA